MARRVLQRPRAAALGIGFVLYLLSGARGGRGSERCGVFPTAAWDVAPSPSCLLLADLNGDDRLDAIVGNSSRGDVWVLLASSDGGFQSQTPYVVSDMLVSMALGDFDRDGRLDFAASTIDWDMNPIFEIVVGFGVGDGGFGRTTRYRVSRRGGEMAASDLDGDGWLDLALATGDAVTILWGQSGGMFASEELYPLVGRSLTPLAVGDVDRDGRLDIVVADYVQRQVGALLGRGGRAFEESAWRKVAWGPNALALGDVDADGWLDAVTAEGSGVDSGVSVLFGSPGGFTAAVRRSVGDGPWSLALADLDRDGLLDIVTAIHDDPAGVQIIRTRPGRKFEPLAKYVAGNAATAVAVGDLDGDGWPDIAVTEYRDARLIALYGRQDGEFIGELRTEAASATLPSFCRACPVLEDLNADGALDAVSPGQPEVVVALGRGEGTFRPPTAYATGCMYACLDVGDLGGDGFPDVVVSCLEEGELRILRGQKGGRFGAPTRYPVPPGIGALRIADLNQDGLLDISAAYPRSGELLLFLNRPDGTFESGGRYSVPSETWLVEVGDVDGNGTADIVAATWNSRYVTVLLGGGDGSFEPVAPRNVGVDIQRLVLADMDADGRLDIVAGPGGARGLAVLASGRDGEFSLRAVPAFGEDVSDFALGDLNGDGSLDAVGVVGWPNGEVSVVLSAGGGSFEPQVAYALRDSPESVALGDLDGDGRLDIATRSSSALSVLLNLCRGGGSSKVRFSRGDATADGAMYISDPVAVVRYLVDSSVELPCEDAADADDNGTLTTVDAVVILRYLFVGDPPPPAPFGACGLDGTPDDLTCAQYPPCGE